MTEALFLAKRNLKYLNREIEYLGRENDEDYLVNACFVSYMIIEHTLKHLLETKGLPSNFTHEIKTLVKMCVGYEIPIPKQVLMYSSEMKDWQMESLYNQLFNGEVELIQELHGILNDWVKGLEEQKRVS